MKEYTFKTVIEFEDFIYENKEGVFDNPELYVFNIEEIEYFNMYFKPSDYDCWKWVEKEDILPKIIKIVELARFGELTFGYY